MKTFASIVIRIASGELSKELAFREFRNAEGVGQPPRFSIGDYMFVRSPKNEEDSEYFHLQTKIEVESLIDPILIQAEEQIVQWLKGMAPKYKWEGDVLVCIPQWIQWKDFEGKRK
jgi:hypothetical protein